MTSPLATLVVVALAAGCLAVPDPDAAAADAAPMVVDADPAAPDADPAAPDAASTGCPGGPISDFVDSLGDLTRWDPPAEQAGCILGSDGADLTILNSADPALDVRCVLMSADAFDSTGVVSTTIGPPTGGFAELAVRHDSGASFHLLYDGLNAQFLSCPAGSSCGSATKGIGVAGELTLADDGNTITASIAGAQVGSATSPGASCVRVELAVTRANDLDDTAQVRFDAVNADD